MEQEPRKATDVLLDLETKINQLIQQIQSLDLKLGVISNKLNSINLSASNVTSSKNNITVETVNTISNPAFQSNLEKNIPISSEEKITEEVAPVGFRRTSRPETFAGDDAYINKSFKKEPVTKFPVQIPKPNGQAEIIVPAAVVEKIKPVEQKKSISTGSIPTMQRIVDKNGKSIFLADVEIVNSSTEESITTTRTNGTGKWQAALSIGTYRVTVRKRESLTKEKMEAIQTITVDGTQSPLDLPMMIIK